ncbi:hypothetical protein K525DRAFT_230961 [Schizophyllum commune Loenen D]|nr:hypothetical protein K525DRAFT_230961 [Schizophyllum commune Loenen D]
MVDSDHKRRVSAASTTNASTTNRDSESFQRSSSDSKRILDEEDEDRDRDSPSPIDNIRPVPTREQTVDPRWLPTYIPPDHPRRTLVVCLDGTGDQFDADNSNIVRFFSMLKKDDKEKQMVYYQSGIGTYTSPQIMTPLTAKVMRVPWNLDSHVMHAYEFLMQNYTVGDSICLFGFSRGAYTARSLAGMIHKVGLLPADNWQQVPFAYKMYTRADEIGWKQSNAFKKAFSRDVSIQFVGVWDTVDSVGIVPKRLPFTTSNTIVHTFRHALALDERRAKFLPNVWNQPTKKESHIATPENNRKTTGKKRTSEDSAAALSAMERLYSERSNHPTDVQEVWFAGCHCDVGGGSVKNNVPHSLARISLRWMVRECFKTDSGIIFEAARLKEIGLDPSDLYPIVAPRPPARSKPAPVNVAQADKQPLRQEGLHDFHGPDGELLYGNEEEEELKDALSPKYDQLRICKAWYLLELLPIKIRKQNEQGEWTHKHTCNLARGRTIPKQKAQGIKVHRSVRMRQEAMMENGKKYKPKAQFFVQPTYVD